MNEKLLIYIGLFAWMIAVLSADRGEWNAFGSYQYYVSGKDDIKPYADGEKFCEDNSGEMAMIKSSEIQTFIQNQVSATSGTPYGFYIGSKEVGTSNTFIWNDKSELTYDNWNAGEPTSNSTEPCVVMGWLLKYYANLPWYDVDCAANSATGFVCQRLIGWNWGSWESWGSCECPGIRQRNRTCVDSGITGPYSCNDTSTQSEICAPSVSCNATMPLIPLGRGNWFPNGSYEYYVSPGGISRSYEVSKTFCKEREGELALIKNEMTQGFIKTLVSDGSGEPYTFYIGLVYDKSKLMFQWNDGTNLSFPIWDEGEPNNHISGTETCVSIGERTVYDANLLWHTVDCITGATGSKGLVCQRRIGKYWETWSSWSECNCSTIIKMRKRTCINSPRTGPDACVGSHNETANCTKDPTCYTTTVAETTLPLTSTAETEQDQMTTVTYQLTSETKINSTEETGINLTQSTIHLPEPMTTTGVDSHVVNTESTTITGPSPMSLAQTNESKTTMENKMTTSDSGGITSSLLNTTIPTSTMIQSTNETSQGSNFEVTSPILSTATTVMETTTGKITQSISTPTKTDSTSTVATTSPESSSNQHATSISVTTATTTEHKSTATMKQTETQKSATFESRTEDETSKIPDSSTIGILRPSTPAAQTSIIGPVVGTIGGILLLALIVVFILSKQLKKRRGSGTINKGGRGNYNEGLEMEEQLNPRDIMSEHPEDVESGRDNSEKTETLRYQTFSNPAGNSDNNSLLPKDQVDSSNGQDSPYAVVDNHQNQINDVTTEGNDNAMYTAVNKTKSKKLTESSNVSDAVDVTEPQYAVVDKQKKGEIINVSANPDENSPVAYATVQKTNVEDSVKMSKSENPSDENQESGPTYATVEKSKLKGPVKQETPLDGNDKHDNNVTYAVVQKPKKDDSSNVIEVTYATVNKPKTDQSSDVKGRAEGADIELNDDPYAMIDKGK
uniref:uncharacterized protein LOC120344507 isoform X2 n=1 Tax=Styela clava TaxID=7725 RepID=UPI0019397D9F|nr:uncharacterized protein LOC120344507 isoform X2 [Styela clava]